MPSELEISATYCRFPRQLHYGAEVGGYPQKMNSALGDTVVSNHESQIKGER